MTNTTLLRSPTQSHMTTAVGYCWRVIFLCAALGFAAPVFGQKAFKSSRESAQVELAKLIEAGESFKAEQLCRQLLRIDPHDSQAFETLQTLTAQRTSVPAHSKAFAAADSRLPQHFGLMQTQRFVLLSDADAAVTAEHGRWVERTYQEFERFVEQCGLRPLPLEHKLVCVLFERRDEYQAFARSQDGVHSTAITGYYSPRNDRVVFALEGSRSNSERSRARLAAGQTGSNGESREVLGFTGANAGGESSHAGSASQSAHEVAGHCPSSCAAKCVHETIHQLMFHTRLMAPEVQYPLWICEGLSTAFETTNPEEPFGPDHEFAPRRDVFDRLMKDGQLLSLHDLVQISQLQSNDANHVRAVYHQSYALVTWICRNRQSELGAYLRSMATEPAGRLTGARHLELFKRAFGDVEEVERAWLEHERSRDS